MVTPSVWSKASAPSTFSRVQLQLDKHIAHIASANSYFSVGEDIAWWVYSKKASFSSIIETRLIDNIHEKLKKRKNTLWHYRDFGSVDQKQQHLVDYETEVFSYPVIWTFNSVMYAKPEKIKHRGWKVIVNNSGYFPTSVDSPYIRITETEGVGLGVFGIRVATRAEAYNVASWVTSKLYRTVVRQCKTSGFNNLFSGLEYLGAAKMWTDEELYKHFNLTAEEIAYVEANVK
jgi:hypothetical protein